MYVHIRMKSNTTVESIQDGIENGNESTAFAHLKKDQSMTSIPIFFIKTPCHNQLEKNTLEFKSATTCTCQIKKIADLGI